jgi:tetratricopeptide (TPR) repeat protein
VTHDEATKLQLEGRYSDLLRAAVAEQVLAKERGDVEEELWWTFCAVRACRFIGRTYEATAHAAHAALRAQELDRQDLLAEATYAGALALKGAGRPVEALAALDRAMEMLPAATPDFTRAVHLLERAELALEAGRPDEAKASLAKGAARVHGIQNTRLLAWTLYLRGMLEDPLEAAALFAAARAIASGIQCGELEWQILWRLAESLVKTGNEAVARDACHKALEIVRRLAAPLLASDAAAFWRLPARAGFLEFVRERFGPAFEVESPAVTIEDETFDPSLLPAFVQASLPSPPAS